MRDTIVFKPIFHRGTEQIGIYFSKNKQTEQSIKKIKGIKWSQTNQCWYVALNKDDCENAIRILNNHADINTAPLRDYLLKRKQVEGTLAISTKKKTALPVPATVARKLSSENLGALEKFVERLKLKAYSDSTIRTYRNEFLQLLQLLKNKPVKELTADDVKRYMVYILEKEGIKEHTAHSRLNALKFYFEQVLGREKFFWDIPRPKKPILLPNVLGEKEIIRLFNALKNPKHKAILFTAYSAGLRVSEVVGLRLKDIDSERMQIKVVAAKGKKDRYVGLSPVLLDILRAYFKKSNPRPVTYIFESEKPGEPYSSRSAQKVFQRARERAGIRKDVSFHSLRRSFATHLLEKGIDIRYIKDILGHFSIKTTERYTHVRKEQLIHIPSPLDDLWLKGDIL